MNIMNMIQLSKTKINDKIIRISKKSFTLSKTNNKALECGSLEYSMPCSRSKILDFLLVFSDFDYSISDITRNSGLSFKTGLNEIRKLKAENLIINSRNIGKAKMFKLNTDNPQVKILRKLTMEIANSRNY